MDQVVEHGDSLSHFRGTLVPPKHRGFLVAKTDETWKLSDRAK